MLRSIGRTALANGEGRSLFRGLQTDAGGLASGARRFDHRLQPAKPSDPGDAMSEPTEEQIEQADQNMVKLDVFDRDKMIVFCADELVERPAGDDSEMFVLMRFQGPDRVESANQLHGAIVAAIEKQLAGNPPNVKAASSSEASS